MLCGPSSCFGENPDCSLYTYIYSPIKEEADVQAPPRRADVLPPRVEKPCSYGHYRLSLPERFMPDGVVSSGLAHWTACLPPTLGHGGAMMSRLAPWRRGFGSSPPEIEIGTGHHEVFSVEPPTEYLFLVHFLETPFELPGRSSQRTAL